MMINEELKRLISETNEKPEIDVMQVEVACNGNASDVLERVREAFTVILSVENICEDNDELPTEGSYDLLESWFEYNVLTSHKDEELNTDIANVRYFGDDRDWFWWTARIIDDHCLYVYLKIEGFPVSGFDNLRWLLQCCGALEVEQGPPVRVANIPSLT